MDDPDMEESQAVDDGRPSTVRVRSRLARPYTVRIERGAPTGNTAEDPEVAAPEAAGRTGRQSSRLPRADTLPGLRDASGGQVPDELAFDVPSPPPDRSRAVLTGVAVLTLLGSAGAFGKLVLFAPPWS